MRSYMHGRHWKVKPLAKARAPITIARSLRCWAIWRMPCLRRWWTRPMSMTPTSGAMRSPAPERISQEILIEPAFSGGNEGQSRRDVASAAFSGQGGSVIDALKGGGPTRLSVVGEAQRVWKAFGETQALRDVSLAVEAGTCHALVGRNGAGKSTLVAILTGLTRPDRGSVRLGGEAALGLADRASWQRRVACVYQKPMVVPDLTVAENVFLNRAIEDQRGFIRWRTMEARARQVMLDWGFDLDVRRRACDLTVEQRQVVEIARTLSVGARFLILDDPTASLEKAAIGRLFASIRRLKESGVGILYISHHLEEIYEVCEQVTVLRDGTHILSAPVSEIRQNHLIEAMVGMAPQQAETISASRRAVSRPRLEVSHLH